MKQEAPQQRHSRWESSDFQSEEHVNTQLKDAAESRGGHLRDLHYRLKAQEYEPRGDPRIRHGSAFAPGRAGRAVW